MLGTTTGRSNGDGWGAVRLHRSVHVRRQRLRRRLLGVFPVLALVFALVWAGLVAFTPSVGDAEARVQAAARAHATIDPGGRVPTLFGQALVATEDSRFFSHHGVDSLGVLRAVTGPLRGGGDPGGSTLDQQLAKELYGGGTSNGLSKLAQVALAVKLDQRFSKQQILEMYASTVYFGGGFYGLSAAACGYFGRSPAELSQGQASLLAGLPQAPSAYDPLTHFILARSRQRHVLDRLVAIHAISAAQATATFQAPLQLLAHHAGTGCR